MRKPLQLAALTLAVGWFLSCGTPGAPLPPSLELPKPVSDLSAAREGDVVMLSWTPPVETTDHARIRHPGPTRICREIQHQLTSALSKLAEQPVVKCADVVRILTPGPRTSGQTPARVSVRTEIEPNLERQNPTGALRFAVEVTNSHGRAAGLSNAAVVALAPTWPPPTLQARVTKRAIELSWTPAREATIDGAALAGYRIRRVEVGAASAAGASLEQTYFVPLGSSSDGRFDDPSFTWGRTYRYRISAVTRVRSPEGAELAEVEGASSPVLEITPRDVFPPSVPVQVQVAFAEVEGRGFIDLIWQPVSDPDLAGYNVYRRTADGAQVRLNQQLVRSPAYHDTDVLPGVRYWYSISALDVRGNESARSEEASEQVPRQR